MANIKLHTWDPTSKQLVYSPLNEFQNLIVLSAVPPPDTSRPCWWGDQANAFTAALCLAKLAVGVGECILQIFSLLSLPPEASCCWSNDHFKPQTYCLCPINLATNWFAALLSRIRIFLSLDPLAKTLFVFQAMAPTLPPCPLKILYFLVFSQSQSCTYPPWVPTAKVFEDGLDDVLVTRSF